jgi:two-component system nitrogen regulation response regulator NtrX
VSTAVEATKLGRFDFIEKPLASERVLLTIRNALDQTRLVDENRSLKRAVEARHQMVGESASLRQIWDAIKRAAPTNATVLLLGESGAGKELVARAIHRNSLRSRDRFIQVNCAAIPEELIESSSSATRRARSPARPRSRSASSSRRTAARSSSTRSAT